MHLTASSKSGITLRSCIVLSVTGKPRTGVITLRQGHSSTLIRVGDGHNTKTGLKWQIHFVGVEEGKLGIFSLLVHARCLIRLVFCTHGIRPSTGRREFTIISISTTFLKTLAQLSVLLQGPVNIIVHDLPSDQNDPGIIRAPLY